MTPFQEAGLQLAALSREFSTVWGSRNLPECDRMRANAACAAVRAYMKGTPANYALLRGGFTINASEA